MSEFNIRIAEALAENVLAALAFNNQCAAQLLLTITPDMFEDPGMRLIAERSIDYLRKYNKPPGRHLRDLFEPELRQRNTSGTSFQRTLDMLDMIAGHLQPDYVMDQLDTFVETARIRAILEKAKNTLNNGDVEGAKLALAHQAIQVSYEHGIWLHKPDEMLRFLKRSEDSDLFSSGIEELDRRGIRPARKTLMVLIAPPKAGKSWYLINQGKYNLMRRKRVLHITCENSEDITALRYIQCLYAMATHDLGNDVTFPFFDKSENGSTALRYEASNNPTLVVDENQKASLSLKLGQLVTRPHFLIKEFPSGTLTVPMLIAFMDMLERVEGFVPDLLIVDYPKVMRVDSRDYRLSLGRILIELRGIAVDKNIAVTTVMQGSKLSRTAKVVNGTMVAEDYSVVGTADTILTYSQTPEEKKIGLARILVDAARNARDSYLVMVSQSYATGQFCLDSVFMANHFELEPGPSGGPQPRPDDTEDSEPTL